MADALAWERTRPNFFTAVSDLGFSRERYAQVFDLNIKTAVPRRKSQIARGAEYVPEDPEVPTWDPETDPELLEKYLVWKRKFLARGFNYPSADHAIALNSLKCAAPKRRRPKINHRL